MDEAKDAVLQITIPFPYEIERGFGYDASSGPRGVQVNFRCLNFEREKFNQAGGIIGLSLGEFIRRVMNDVSDVILAMNNEEFQPLERYKVIKK